jgi:3-hydroxyacyl-CoA dehydrogenase
VKGAALIADLQDRFWHATEALLFRHSNPWELDEALTARGFSMGPCEAQDLFGLEKVLARCPDRPSPVLERMVAEGRLGKIGGVGFYRYPCGGGAVIDPLIEDLILEEAWFAQAARTELPDDELFETLRIVVMQWREERAAMVDDAAFRQLLRTALHYEGEPLGR